MLPLRLALRLAEWEPEDTSEGFAARGTFQEDSCEAAPNPRGIRRQIVEADRREKVGLGRGRASCFHETVWDLKINGSLAQMWHYSRRE